MLTFAVRRVGGLLLVLATAAAAAEPQQTEPLLPQDVEWLLEQDIVGDVLPVAEIQHFIEARVPRVGAYRSAAEWEVEANRLRQAVLERIVFRGQAAAWRQMPQRVEWLDTIDGGPGYRIRKLRFEAVPGLFIPALLYEPEKLIGKVPVVMNVHGHHLGEGKSVPAKQIRCINQVKRGMLVLSPEWIGTGQMATPGFAHQRMNQLDLCGTSGLAVFYLALERGLDLLLSLEHADASRVAVTGLSGGGWQTIFISSLDPRVTLANPVAGYSSLLTRVYHLNDIGDSEQAPCDLATLVDYTHLTALRAPRPTLLTYNSKDDCCFTSDYALKPLVDAGRPLFQLYDKESALQWHVNVDPGTHNYERDNRQAFYQMLGDYFYPDDKEFDAIEIPSDNEVKSKEELTVPLGQNEDFNSLALALAKPLPRQADLPGQDLAAAKAWQQTNRDRLRDLLCVKECQLQPVKDDSRVVKAVHATFWKFLINGALTVPAVDLVQGAPRRTAILVADAGRASTTVEVLRLLAAGCRVVALDPAFIGESAVDGRLFSLLVPAVGERPLGMQAGQVVAVARWAKQQYEAPVLLVSAGQRSSMAVLAAAALGEQAIDEVELHGSRGSLKELIETNAAYQQAPELFCFGLLETFDVKQLVALAAPRPVRFVSPSDRAKTEISDLPEWYRLLGSPFDPLADP